MVIISHLFTRGPAVCYPILSTFYSSGLLEKLIKEFPSSYGTRKFFTVFTKDSSSHVKYAITCWYLTLGPQLKICNRRFGGGGFVRNGDIFMKN
jgi:hypothetical protein